MRKYSLNLFRWLKYFYLKWKYKNSKWVNFFAPKPMNKKYLLYQFKYRYEQMLEELGK